MMNNRFTRSKAALDLVEAAHDGAGDWQTWCDRLLAAAQPLFKLTALNVGLVRRLENSYDCIGESKHSLPPGYALAATVPAAALDPLWRSPSLVSTSREVLESSSHKCKLLEQLVQGFEERTGAWDALGLVAMVDDVSLIIGVPDTKRIILANAERRLLEKVTLHLEAGLALRLEPGSEVALLDPLGKFLDIRGPTRDAASTRAQLSQHVSAIEKARARRARQSASALEIWSALISGNFGIVERTDSDGKRFYVVIKTPRRARVRALSHLEVAVLELSARGLTGKAVAYALGVDTSVVSHALSSASIKLGIRSRTELVGLAAKLLGTSPTTHENAELTDTERDVLQLVRFGWTNAMIAHKRQRSERTIAHQVSSLLRKLNAPSRRSLATLQL